MEGCLNDTLLKLLFVMFIHIFPSLQVCSKPFSLLVVHRLMLFNYARRRGKCKYAIMAHYFTEIEIKITVTSK